MRSYDKIKPPSPNLLFQGFWIGLFSGMLGAVVMLGRRGRSNTTL